ncbi:PhoH family protein [Pleionea mediterranea]|uniref:PhoH-like protein n=1 Tax=Pleionea mediterranea TaxID=523701 RepID=A0A316GGZ9_9GAMM|nr:PhoH family protein [Pleionea mediterranea]PWK54007.1 phosphate starvation-inducible protein PhoH [Pleionea mediterranea]
MTETTSIQFDLEPADNERLADLCGYLDENFRLIERRLGIEVNNRGNAFQLIGETVNINAGRDVIEELYQETGQREALKAETVHVILQSRASQLKSDKEDKKQPDVVITTKRGLIRPRGHNQQRYVERILASDISFGIGPAGTGKTYLAVAAAVDALERQEIRRIILTRPAVEAGERLGFLPGDLNQKVDPYLRPLYDALYEMLGFERVAKLMERNVIEVAPLAYMRGRTLNEAFIILDESQNTTAEQMKMLLTRIGFGSKAVITGDITQVDLPRGTKSGLRQAIEVLKNIKEISFTFFQSADVVRHPVVQRVVQAYEKFDLDSQKDK